MADPKIPQEFQDAVDNPANDPDPYAPFDPESEDYLAAQMVATQPQRRASIMGTKAPKVNLRQGAMSPEFAEREATRMAQAFQATRTTMDEASVLDYVTPKAKGIQVRDVANFLLGDEMGAIGIKLDNDHISWSMENAIKQWSDHPLRTPVALASWALPGLGKVIKAKRLAKYAGITAQEAYDMKKIDNVDDWLRMTPDNQNIIRANIHQETTLADLLNKAKNTPERMDMKDTLQLWFYKNWAHSYSKLSDPSSSAVHDLNFKERMDKLLQDEVIAPYVMTAPDNVHGQAIARYWTGDVGLGQVPLEARAWAQGMGNSLEELQGKMLNTGFLTEETVEKVGRRYVPLLPKGKEFAIGGPTAQVTVFEKGRPVVHEIGRMESPALLERTTGLDEFIEMIKAEEVIMDPKTLTVRGLMEGTLLYENHMNIVKMASDPRFGTDSAGFAKAVEALGGGRRGLAKAKDEWLPLWGDATRPGFTSGATGDRLRRMVAKEKGISPDDLGAHYLSRDSFHQMFGPNGVVGQSRDAAKAFEEIVRIYKTSKTAFNAYTQGQNIMGNVVFLSMRGMRFFGGAESGENWKLLQSGMANMNSHLNALRKAQKTGKGGVGKLKSMTVGDKTFSPAEIAAELDSTMVKELLEEGAFLNSEGSNLNFLSRAADKADNFSSFLGSITRKTEDFLSTWKRFYNVGDSGPKFAYFMKLRAGGLSRSAAVQEVAKALPIYRGIAEGPRVPGLGRVGPASLRKMMFPWISFPAETARIMKNNIMDHPLRVMPWLKSVNIMQAMMYGAGQVGVGTPFSYDDHLGVRRQLPIHAQRPTAVTTPFTDRNGDIRSMMMDFLPFSTVLPPTFAEEAPAISKIPVVSPEDIAPIFTGIIGLMTGKGPFGQELKTTGPADAFGKHLANMIGFIAPPYVQKYMFDIASPRQQSITGLNTYKMEQDLGKVVNPQTGKPGSWLYDHLLNNTVFKNYASSAEQEMFNRSLKLNRTVEGVRGELTRRWNAAIRSNKPEDATGYLQQVQETFIKEYGPGPIAQQKFSEWAVRHRRSLHRHPQLRRYSLEDITRMMIENNTVSKQQRTIARDKTAKALQREYMLRQMVR